MSRHEKLREKLLKFPRNFTYDEMITLLKDYGYIKEERRRSSGSAVMFYNKELSDKIMFHKPHPEKELKRYILEMIIEKLKNNKML
jgi:predicted RNA binding protein YcfA (HicA-like mRNA interferase family)